jgi:sodium/potassium-transporting ATPase subunit alpha
MIAELLRPETVVVSDETDLGRAQEELLRRLPSPLAAGEMRLALERGEAHRYSYIGDNIAIPHLRVEGIKSPEVVLGIFSNGLRLDRRDIQIILLLATPANETEEHLKLLQRLTSLLPAIREPLLRAREPQAALRAVASGEQAAGKATYLNLTQEQVAFELRTDPQRGLTGSEARRRLEHYGQNALKRSRRAPWYLKLAANFFSFFAALLWMAAALCFAPGVDMPQLGVAIIVVIVINGLFAFLQEQRSDRAIDLLENLMARKCLAVRDGEIHEIDAATLVPGDVILLKEGDVVPADARLVEAFEVEVDNSALTGEAHPARRYKSDRPVLVEGKSLWIEMPNIVFAGTALVRGQAKAVVIGTGMRSEIGKIVEMTQGIRLEPSPLQVELKRAVFVIAGLAAAFAVAFLLLGWLAAGLSFVQAFVFFIGIFVANVPEGLLPTVTLSLAMGVTRMARRNALVKDLPSVEALGCTTVICCDKTGTLTQNRMMATAVCVDGEVVEVTGSGYAPRGDFLSGGRPLLPDEIGDWLPLRRLLECAHACNNARLEKAGGEYRAIGDPTEAALLTLAEKGGMRGTHHRIHVNHFDSFRKRMSVVVRLAGRSGKTAYMKGAPLETLSRCDRILARGAIRPLNEADARSIAAQNDALAGRGLRVLALAYRDDSDLDRRDSYTSDEIERHCVFLGLVALSDPIRPGVAEAVRACHAAGIRVLMITGDYPLTARAIAQEAGIGAIGPLRVLTGAEMSEKSDAEMRSALKSGEYIFARVAPEHKLRIVTLLKEIGETVAVTGDGVNDAPALKKADIGIAMGLSGNDVAKEAADMILTDDNFNSIVAAIEEGRAVFQNIRRFMAYILNSNPQEMYPYIFWMLFPGMPLAMTVMGVLAVDVGTDLVPAMGLGIEPPEKGVMERPPRPRGEKLVSLGFILRSYFVEGTILTLSSYATYYYAGWALGYWRPGQSLAAMPGSPADLQLSEASPAYLQSLTAYFFPTVTTQMANVLCKRSTVGSLFSRDFLNPLYRRAILERTARWRPPFGPRIARFLDRHYIICNFVSNPLIDIGIIFALALCYLFFHTPLARIYYFAPVPWHVYLFACHGTVLLFTFEEAKKYRRRRRETIHRLRDKEETCPDF